MPLRPVNYRRESLTVKRGGTSDGTDGGTDRGVGASRTGDERAAGPDRATTPALARPRGCSGRRSSRAPAAADGKSGRRRRSGSSGPAEPAAAVLALPPAPGAPRGPWRRPAL